MATDEASLSSLQTDGLSASLYSYLWTKHDGLGFSCNVPDTLVYRSRCLDAWYFTSAMGTENGMLKKRGPSYLTNEAIMTFFKDRASDGFDIVAVLITQKEIGNRLDYVSGTSACSLEYLTLPALGDFLLNKRKPLSGILQKFLLPKGSHNSVLQAVWTPNSALFRLDRRTTRLPLPVAPTAPIAHTAQAPVQGQGKDATSSTPSSASGQVQPATSAQAADSIPRDLLERVCTYDGPPYLSTEAAVRGDALPAAVRSLCEGLAAHVFAVTRGQAVISKMVLMLKMAKDGKVYLLYASSVRLDDAGTASKIALLKTALSLPAPSTLRSLGSPVADDSEPITTPASGGVKGKSSARRSSNSHSPLDGGPSHTLTHTSKGAATVASSVHRLQAALRDPASLQASSSKGPVNLEGSPQSKSAAPPAHLHNASPSRQRHILIDRLADVAEEEGVDALRAAKYLDRRAELYAPADRHDHRIPLICDGTQCPSCGRAMLAGKTGACTVQHTMVVKHYEALCKLLRVEPFVDPGHALQAMSKGGHLPGPEIMAALAPKDHQYWPTAAQTLAVSGGVGVYAAFPPGTIDTGVEVDEEDEARGSSSGGPAAPAGGTMRGAKTVLEIKKEPCDFYGEPIRLLVPEVPPTLLAVQPTLRAATYRSLRRDPLWLVKTVTVCDACFVGYTTLQEAFMAGTDPMLALLQTANALGSRGSRKSRSSGAADSSDAPVAAPSRPVHKSFISEAKDVETAMAFAATLQTKSSMKAKERSRQLGQTESDAHDTVQQQLAFATVESGAESDKGVHVAGAQGKTVARRSDPRSAGVSEALIATAERLLGTPVPDGSPRTALYTLPSSIPATTAARRMGKILSTSHYAEVELEDSSRGIIKSDDPTYSIRAQSCDVKDYPQPDPSTGLLSAGLLHYGKRSYLGLVRVAAQWETIAIDWNKDAYAKHEARLPGYPASDSEDEDEDEKEDADEDEDAASVHEAHVAVLDEGEQQTDSAPAATESRVSSGSGDKEDSSPLAEVLRAHEAYARRVHRIIPDDQHFCVYMKSTKSGRTMAMYMRGTELCRSGNPICRAAAKRWKQLYMPSVRKSGTESVSSQTPPVTAPPAGRAQEGLIMQGLFSTAAPKRVPKAVVSSEEGMQEPHSTSEVENKVAAPQPHTADYCVLSCKPRPPEQCTVRGELLFTLSVHRLGEAYSAEIGPVTYDGLVTACTSGGHWHAPLVYAAKARLVSSILAAEGIYGSKLLMIQAGHTVDNIMTVNGSGVDAYAHLALTAYGSLPLAGAVLRLTPGHFLGGRGSLDRYRAWNAAKMHDKSSDTAAMRMLQGIINPEGLSKAEREARRKAALAIESYLRDQRAGKGKTKPILMKDMLSPVEVATTLETVMDLPIVQAKELQFTAAMAPLKPGIIARTMIVLPSAHTLVVTLTLETPGTAGSAAPGASSAHARAEELLHGHNAPQFVMKIFSLTDGQLLRMSAESTVLQKPVTAHAVCTELEQKTVEDWSDLPANPLLQLSALSCLSDVPRVPGEEMIAARIVPGLYAQRFVGMKDMESAYHACRDPWGPHASIKTGGSYLLSLSVVRCKEEGGQDVPFPAADGLTGPTLPGCVDVRVTRTEASLRKALIEAKAAGRLTREEQRAARQAIGAEEGPGADLHTLHLPSRGMLFLVRCQYLVHPLPLYEALEDHDEQAVRLAEASGKVVKSGDMLVAEVQHWVRHGQLPTAIALVRAVKGGSRGDGDASMAAAPRVRACQTAAQPVYSYVLQLEHMCRPDLNPFIDLLGGLPAAMEAADRS